MQLNMQQLKQIIKYNPGRMYFGNWSGTALDDCYNEALRTHKAQKMYVGDLNNDIICNALWYEMSYNPFRFGTKSPFIWTNKNDILYFDYTYKQNQSHKTKDFLPDEIVNLTWNISVFIKKLQKAGWYDNFMLNGELPHYFNIVGGKSLTNDIVSFNHEHSILNSLIGAINAITKQNFIDLYNQDYHDEIIRMVQQRHPTYKRSDISYMMVNAENISKANEHPGR